MSTKNVAPTAGKTATPLTAVASTRSAPTATMSSAPKISPSASAAEAGLYQMYFLLQKRSKSRCDAPYGPQGPNAAKMLRLSFHDCLK